MNSTPLWFATSPRPAFPTLDRDLTVDVLIVGGGITGVTAAHLLARAGKKVALLERDRVGEGDTGHTTSHMTYVTDTRLRELVRTFGREHARAVWDAGCFALMQIEQNVTEEKLDCEFRFIPGFLFAPAGADRTLAAEEFREEAALAAELGFDAPYLPSAPVVMRPAIRFANQLKVHPLKYVVGLAERVRAAGGDVFEQSEVSEFSESPRQARCNGCIIRFEHVILATHVPIQGLTSAARATLFQTKLAGYSTYAVGAKLPRGQYPEALFWDTNDPYLYLRIDRREDGDYAILGGEDHKTGQDPQTEERYARLSEKLCGFFSSVAVDTRWSGQVIETHDGLPFIGEIADGQWIATGFGGNGTTFGTLGAIMAKDAILGIRNPWSELFSVERKTLSAAWDYLQENKDYPYYFARGQFAGRENEEMAALKNGEGCVIRQKGEKLAVSRDETGHLTALSAVCPHMGCVVSWNPAEKTWDCPCHGSRFRANGEVMAGPAESPLEPRRAS